MHRLTLPAMVMAAMTLGALDLAAGEPQRARPRGGDGGAAGAPRSGTARAPARRPPPARVGRPSPRRPSAGRPAARGVPRRAPAPGAGARPRVRRVPDGPRAGVVSERSRARAGAPRRRPGDVGAVERAVPRRGRPPGVSPGYGERGGRVRGGGRYGRGPHRHVHRPRLLQPRVYGTYFHFPGYAFDLHFGYPYYYGPRWGGYPYWRPYDAPYLDHEDPYTGYLRLKVKPRAAEVYADGYYVGLVDHFDGVFQRLHLLEGPHRIEIRHPGYRPLEIEVLIVAGGKVTYEALLEPRQAR